MSATSVTDVARAAACSRPTVYRWFDDRDALLEAFVHRAARRIGARVAAEVGRRGDPQRRLVDGVLVAVEGVRADPTLAAWFAGGALLWDPFAATPEADLARLTSQGMNAHLVSPWMSLAVVAAALAVTGGIALALLARGYKLRN